ncbi:MAG: cation:proton antiporter [Solirubrobacterales bacterium]
MLVCLGLAAFAARDRLAALIGAFLAGMIVAETKDQHPIEEEVEPLYAFFPPFFFAFIGIEPNSTRCSTARPWRYWR